MCVSFICSFSQVALLLFTSLLLFHTCVLDALQACVLKTLSHSCYFSKLAFLSSSSLCSCCSFRSCSCYFSKSCSCYFSWLRSYCSKLATRVIVAPSSCSYCSSWSCFCCLSSCSCCSKLVVRILVAPSLHSYCSFQSCSCYSKVAFLLLLSVMLLLLQAHVQVLLFPVVFLLFQARIWVLFFMVAFFYFEFAFLLIEVWNCSWIPSCWFWFFNFLFCVLVFMF